MIGFIIHHIIGGFNLKQFDGYCLLMQKIHHKKKKMSSSSYC
jgi:hypothetical protein